MNACEDWEGLHIPSQKVVNLNKDSTSPVFDVGKVDDIQYLTAHQVLQHLVAQTTQTKKKAPVKSISEQLSSVHAVTLYVVSYRLVYTALNPVIDLL